MRLTRLQDMVQGWFIGDFAPSVLRTPAVEVAVHHRQAGTVEPLHTHRIATEVTVLISGKARMAGLEMEANDIVMLPPGNAASFESITDTVAVVVKMPSLPGDKYLEALP